MRRRRDQREGADAVGLVERERQRDRAAERMADDQRLSEFQDPNGAGQDHRLFADPAGDRRGIAGARPVEGDHTEVVRQPADERMGEMTDLAAEPVDENDWRALAPVENVQPSPLDLEKRALRRRHRPIRLTATTDSAANATSSVARIASPSSSPRTIPFTYPPLRLAKAPTAPMPGDDRRRGLARPNRRPSRHFAPGLSPLKLAICGLLPRCGFVLRPPASAKVRSTRWERKRNEFANILVHVD